MKTYTLDSKLMLTEDEEGKITLQSLTHEVGVTLRLGDIRGAEERQKARDDNDRALRSFIMDLKSKRKKNR